MVKGPRKNLVIQTALSFVLCALMGMITAHAEDYGEITITVETVLRGHFRRGYDEYRAIVTNRSPSTTHRVTVLLFTGRRHFGSIREIRRDLEVAPTSTVSISMLAPAETTGDEAAVLIDGVSQDERIRINDMRTNAWTNRPLDRQFMMISGGIESSGLMNSYAIDEGFKDASGNQDVSYLTYNSPRAEWSMNWVGYSGFNGVMVKSDEMRDLGPAAREALLRYVECGGALVVAGQWDVPEQWRERTISLGKNDFGVYFAGFGVIVVTGTTPLAQITVSQWEYIKTLFEGSRPIDKPYYNLLQINKDFSVVERIGIPVRGLFALMLAFVFFIGPINLFWLARPGKKIRMLWTVPLISLITCLTVAGFALFSEGVNATTRTEGITILDEAAHRATTIGWTAYYSPITPGEGLHFSYDTELIPQGIDGWLGGNGRAIDLSSDQNLVSGWIVARVPAYFKFRKSEMRRERLKIRQTASGDFSVVNGLGAGIKQLWFADRSGKIHSGQMIEPGAQVNSKGSGLHAAGKEGAMRAIYYAPDWLERIDYVEKHPAEFLTPGTYLAVLDASPFVETALRNVKTHKAHALVFGIGMENIDPQREP